MLRYALVFNLLFLLFACSRNQQPERQTFFNKTLDSSCQLEYARGYTIDYYGRNAVITVQNPWQEAKAVEYQYVLTDDTGAIADAPTIHTPVNRLVCLSTTHIAMIEALNEIGSVKGISGKSYVMNPVIQKRIKRGAVADVGHTGSFNYETLIELQPDVLFAYEVEGNTGYVKKLKALGIQMAFNADYLETTPLGRMEWIKFVGAFYNKEELASRIFREAARKYNQIRQATDTIKNKPTVFTGLPFKGNWYVPGGNSYMANLIEDAGGRYLWQNNQKRKSIALSNEAVFAKAKNADYWLNTGRMRSLEALKSRDPRFAKFKAYKSMQVYNNNARTNKSGGNDFWETGVIEPHILLKDMVKIFHPEIVPEHEFTYYRKLK